MGSNSEEYPCRICFNESSLYSNIYQHQQLAEKQFLDILNDLLQLDIEFEDGFPQFICAECYKKVMDFELLKRTAHEVKEFLLNSRDSFQIEYIKSENGPTEDEEIVTEEAEVSSVPDCLTVSGEINSEAEWHNQEHRVLDVHTVKGSLGMWNLERCEMPLIQNESNDKVNEESAVIANGGFYNNEENREECRIKETNLYKGRLQNKRRNIDENLAEQYRKPIGKDCRRISTNNGCQNIPLGTKNPGDSIACSVSQKAMKVKNIAKKTVDKPEMISKGSNSLRNKSKSELQHFFCDTCKKGFRYKFSLGIHVRIHNGVRPYQCSLCSKSFTRRDVLLNHNSVHTVGKPHVCTECGKSFKYKKSLIFHSKLHIDHYPFPCVTCGKLFKSAITFQEHLKIHGIVKPFSCKICSKSFASKSILVQHQEIHKANRNKSFSCDTCKKLFSKKSILKLHIYSHDSFKRHKCSICAKLFTLKHNLQRHLRIHSTERAFKCPNCSKCFNRIDYLKYHMKFICQNM